jgi:hypothetical protein
MHSLIELHNNLRNSVIIQSLSKKIVKELLNRNLSPYTVTAMYSGKSIEGDELSSNYNELIIVVSEEIGKTDLSAIAQLDKSEHDGLRVALWFATTDAVIDRAKLTNMVIVDVLQSNMPDIDIYIDSLGSKSVYESLGLVYDRDLLTDITRENFELRQHGLIIDDVNLVYPHQFLRRYYHANFVDILLILRKCILDGMSVKLRLDSLREPTLTKYYRNLIEADHWFGKPFQLSVLSNTDKEEVVTIHRSDDKYDLTYPVKFTIFRSTMMDKGLRQFMVEEYTPTSNPNFPTKKLSGFGESLCIQKFAHFVYDQSSNTFSHFDGAVRTFKVDDYNDVLNKVTQGKDPGSKIGSRHKLFLVEGKISMENTKNLLYEYFRYNPHIAEYFVSLR